MLFRLRPRVHKKLFFFFLWNDVFFFWLYIFFLILKSFELILRHQFAVFFMPEIKKRDGATSETYQQPLLKARTLKVVCIF